MVHHKLRHFVAGAAALCCPLVGGIVGTYAGSAADGLIAGMGAGLVGGMAPFMFWPFTERCPRCKSATRIDILPPTGMVDVLRCVSCRWHD